MINSSITNCTAAAPFGDMGGGAIRIEGAADLLLLNTSILGNVSNYHGSAIYATNSGSIVLANTTVAGNISNGNGDYRGVEINNNNATLTVIDSIIAYNYNSASKTYSDYKSNTASDATTLVMSAIGNNNNSGIKVIYVMGEDPSALSSGATRLFDAYETVVFGEGNSAYSAFVPVIVTDDATGTDYVGLSTTSQANGGRYLYTNIDANGFVTGMGYDSRSEVKEDVAPTLVSVFGFFDGSTAEAVLTDQLGRSFVSTKYAIVGAYAAPAAMNTTVVTVSWDAAIGHTEDGVTLRDAINALVKSGVPETITFAADITEITIDVSLFGTIDIGSTLSINGLINEDGEMVKVNIVGGTLTAGGAFTVADNAVFTIKNLIVDGSGYTDTDAVFAVSGIAGDATPEGLVVSDVSMYGFNGATVFDMQTGTLSVSNAFIGDGLIQLAAGTAATFINTTLSNTTTTLEGGKTVTVTTVTENADGSTTENTKDVVLADAVLTLANVTAVNTNGGKIIDLTNGGTANAYNTIFYGETDLTNAYYSVFSSSADRNGTENVTGASAVNIFGYDTPSLNSNDYGVYVIDINNSSLYSISNGVILGQDNNGSFFFAREGEGTAESPFVWYDADGNVVTGEITAITTDQLGNTRTAVTTVGAYQEAALSADIFTGYHFRTLVDGGNLTGYGSWDEIRWQISRNMLDWLTPDGWRMGSPTADSALSITISENTIVKLTENISLTNLTVAGTLTVADTAKLTITDGSAANDLINNGTLEIAGSVALASGANWNNADGSMVTYDNAAVNSGIVFHDLSITGSVTASGMLDVDGDLTIIHDGVLTAKAGLEIAGSLILEDGANSITTLDLDYTVTDANTAWADASFGTDSKVVYGNGGVLIADDYAGLEITGTVTASADFSAAALSVTSGSTLVIDYANNGDEWTAAGATLTGAVEYRADGSNVVGGTYSVLKVTGDDVIFNSAVTVTDVMNVSGSNADLNGNDLTVNDLNVTAGSLDLGTGTTTVTGDFTVASGASADASGAVVTFNGTSAQNVAGILYKTLNFANSAKTVTGDLTVTDSFDAGDQSVSFSDDAVLTLGGTISNYTNVKADNITAIYNGTADGQTVAALTYGSLTLNGGSKVFTTGATVVEDAFTANASVDFGTASVTLNGTAAVAASVTLDAAEAAFTYGGGDQTVLALTYGSLALTGAGIKTVDSGFKVNTALTLDKDATLKLTYAVTGSEWTVANSTLNGTVEYAAGGSLIADAYAGLIISGNTTATSAFTAALAPDIDENLPSHLGVTPRVDG